VSSRSSGRQTGSARNLTPEKSSTSGRQSEGIKTPRSSKAAPEAVKSSSEEDSVPSAPVRKSSRVKRAPKRFGWSDGDES